LADFDSPIYTVFDAAGKRVMNAKLENKTLNVSALAPGVYFLRVFDNSIIRTQRFIKQ